MMLDPDAATDSELVEWIGYLRQARHLGSWGRNELQDLEHEADRRKLKIFEPKPTETKP